MKSIIKSFFIFHFSFFICMAHAADPNPIPRVSIFSTSTDWESITGLRFSQYDVSFTPDEKLIGRDGLEMYVLDGFPCYGQSDRTQVWFGFGNNTRGSITMVCLYPPEKIYFAWRNAGRDAIQDKTLGMLECPNQSRDSIKIDLFRCTRGKEWKEYR